jgi:hypothetical protein
METERKVKFASLMAVRIKIRPAVFLDLMFITFFSLRVLYSLYTPPVLHVIVFSRAQDLFVSLE